MSLTEVRVRELLAEVNDPLTGQPLAAPGVVRGVGIAGRDVSIDLQLGYPARGVQAELEAHVKAALEADPDVGHAAVSIAWRVAAHQVQEGLTPMPGVRNVIAVASGKGGVGKSTVSANLALALAAEGARVGVLDADIHGPSQARMLGLAGKPEVIENKMLLPKHAHGIQAMSIALMVEEDTAMIWRGPMATQALQQLLGQTDWDDLDYLVVDLPPGTGDIQLTLCQRIPVAGAVIVTTPQDIALLDARKGLKMFEKVNVPVLGIVENMATHVCSRCGHEEAIFGAGGGERMAADYQVPFLGSVPLDIRIREQADSGTPTVAAMPESDIALRYRGIARAAAAQLALRARNRSLGMPRIVVAD